MAGVVDFRAAGKGPEDSCGSLIERCRSVCNAGRGRWELDLIREQIRTGGLCWNCEAKKKEETKKDCTELIVLPSGLFALVGRHFRQSRTWSVVNISTLRRRWPRSRPRSGRHR